MSSSGVTVIGKKSNKPIQEKQNSEKKKVQLIESTKENVLKLVNHCIKDLQVPRILGGDFGDKSIVIISGDSTVDKITFCLNIDELNKITHSNEEDVSSWFVEYFIQNYTKYCMEVFKAVLAIIPVFTTDLITKESFLIKFEF